MISCQTQHKWARLQVGIACEPPHSLIPVKTTLHKIPLCILDLGSHISTLGNVDVSSSKASTATEWGGLNRSGEGRTSLEICLLLLGECEFDPRSGARVPRALWPKIQNTEQKQYCGKFYKDSKNVPHQKKKNLKKNKWGETITLKTLCFSDFRNQWLPLTTVQMRKLRIM